MNNETQRQKFKSTQYGSQGACFMGKKKNETTGVEYCQEYFRQTAASPTTRVTRSPAQCSIQTTYLALLQAL